MFHQTHPKVSWWSHRHLPCGASEPTDLNFAIATTWLWAPAMPDINQPTRALCCCPTRRQFAPDHRHSTSVAAASSPRTAPDSCPRTQSLNHFLFLLTTSSSCSLSLSLSLSLSHSISPLPTPSPADSGDIHVFTVSIVLYSFFSV